MSSQQRPVTRRSVLTCAASLGAGGLSAAATAPADARSSTPLPRSTVAARRKHFGAKNVDRDGNVRTDRLILSWFGVSNFAMALGGRVMLLDAWVPRGEYSGVVPTDPTELTALKPSHLFLGHGHWDHAADAATIVKASGARVVGTPEMVAQVQEQAGQEISSRTLGTAGAPVGEVDRMRVGPIRITSLQHLHSEVKMPEGEFPPLLPSPDLLPILTHFPSLEDAFHEISHLGDEQGGALLYQFRLGRFRLLWNDTCGPISDEAAAPIRGWLRRRRGVDVQMGAVQGFGQFTNGLRDPVDYLKALRPKVLVPTHHDNWAPPITSPGSTYEAPLKKAIAALPRAQRPELRMIRDPDDYVRPGRLTFEL